MGIDNCSKCERRLGEEILQCPLHATQECPYVLKKISNSNNRGLAWSLLVIGAVIFYFTLPLAKPQDYASSILVIVELLAISALFLVSFLAMAIGFFTLRSKRLIAYDPLNKDLWEKEIVGGVELYSRILSTWREIDLPFRFKPLGTNLSKHLYYPKLEDNALNQAIFLSNIFLNLISQGNLKAFIADEYQVSGQSIDDVSDRKRIFLVASKSLPAGSGELEESIYQILCDLQIRSGSHLPVPLNDIVDNLPPLDYLQADPEEHQQINDALIENIYLLDSKKLPFNSKFLEQEIYWKILQKDQSVRKRMDSLLTERNFKHLRVALVGLALVSFILLRFYLPLYRVEKFAGKIDNQKVAQFFKDSEKNLRGLQLYLKDQTRGVIDFRKLEHDLNSQLDDLKLQALEALADVNVNEQYSQFQDEMLKLLSDKSEAVQQQALKVLSDWGKDLNFAAPDLLNLLGSSNPKISYQAAELLGKSNIDPGIALPVLRNYVNHQDLLTRLAVEGAIRSLQQN